MSIFLLVITLTPMLVAPQASSVPESVDAVTPVRQRIPVKLTVQIVITGSSKYTIRVGVQAKTRSKIWSGAWTYPNRNYIWRLRKWNVRRRKWVTRKRGYGKLSFWISGLRYAHASDYFETRTGSRGKYRLVVKLYPRLDPCDWDYILPAKTRKTFRIR